jgi:DNA polymerase-3 subunit delta
MVNGEKKMVTILAGENWLGVKQTLDKCVGQFVEKYGDIAVEKINGAEADLDKIIGMITTQPFLIPKKLCVIHDLSKNKEATAEIEQVLSLDAPDTDIILVESKLDKRSSYYKTIKKLDGFKEFEELDEQGTIDWVMNETKESGGSMSRGDAQYLYSRVGGSQSRLANELKKLVGYNASIDKNSIDLLTEPRPSSSIFDLLGAAFSGQIKSAIKLYEDQRLQKVEPQQILAMIGWQMHVVALVDSAKDVNPSDLAKESSINPFVIKKTRQIASKLNRSQIKSILGELVETDYKIKNTNINADDAVKNLLLSLSSR